MILLVVFIYAQAQKQFFEQKRVEVRHAVESAWSLIDHFVGKARNGQLSNEEAQQQAILAVGAMRYDVDNYFWINDMEPRMVMHPINSALNGEELSRNVDPNGKALFVEMIQVVKNQQSGFVDYEWEKPGFNKPVPKMSFVKGIPEWGWVVGSGLYLDDIYDQLNAIRNIVTAVTVLVLIAALAMALLAARNLSRPLQQAVEMLQAIGQGNLESRLALQRTDEVGVMAQELNRFAANMQ